MPSWILLAALAHGSEATDDADTRFGRVDVAPAPPWEEASPEAAPRTAQPAPPAPAAASAPTWRVGARDQVSGIVGVETQLRQMGASPDHAVIVSAELDWGTLVRDPGDRRGGLGFARSAVTVSSARLSDGEVVGAGRVVNRGAVYALDDPDARARLCTGARTGPAGGPVALRTWTDVAGTGRDADRRDAPSFVMVDGDQGRTALVDLAPGESATIVEVSAPDRRRPLRRHRKIRIERDGKVITITEGDALSETCLEY